MKYLLDTNIVLWWLVTSKKLSSRIYKHISNPRHTLSVSAATIWEIAIKSSLGKLEVPDNIVEKIIEANLLIMPIQAVHAWQVRFLAYHHKDPFDRLLIAQAQLEQLTLVTADPIFRRYEVMVITIK